jgi:NodT family efflux transporter outer membrane factor (OMF) lipoprotein
MVAAMLIPTVGCAAARRPYEPPIPIAPAGWSAGAATGTVPAAGAEALASWWSTFNDPMLTRLVETSVQNNLDVRTALSRIRQARAGLAATSSTRQPSVSASASSTTSQSSREAGSGSTGSVFQAGFDASWEIDVFGGIRSEIVAARATAQAREADLADVLVTLVADVATHYIDVRAFQRRSAIARDNAAAQQESYDLARFRRQAGLTTELDVDQALSNLESTRAQLAALDGQSANARHALSLLLGEPPAALDLELEAPGNIPEAPLSIAVGIPADALRRRPDIRAAERAIAAQAATTDAGRAELYPQFRLAGSIGLQALNAARVFVPGAAFWSVSPSVNWRVFDRAQLRQNLAAQSEVQSQAVLSYESKVLSALREAEDALHAFVNERIRLGHLANAAAAAGRAADLSLQLYTAGLRDFRDVLDAQRSVLALQDQFASSQADVAIDLVKTYKALGGGWPSLQLP